MTLPAKSKFLSDRFSLTSIGLLHLGAIGAAGAPVDFVREVRPILEEHCFDCHGEEKQKSRLRLD